MPVSLKETQSLSKLSQSLYDFLPANPHPYADQSISFSGCAVKSGIGNLWTGGSKKTAISNLLHNTLGQARSSFCKLMLCIVQTSLIYRGNKGTPLTREEIERVNQKIAELGFKIPELWNGEFLHSLPSSKPNLPLKSEIGSNEILQLKEEFIGLTSFDAQARGYAFQDFLNKMFNIFGLNAKKSFRIIGEEIDGSFELGSDIYLMEAKWQSRQSPESELLVFSGKVGGKAMWSRGLFISYAGFTTQGLEAFARGKSTNLIGMDAQDIFFILEGRMSLVDALKAKARQAAETNAFFTSVFSLSD
ncbi:hypothetical protein ABIB40_002924 [Pedobacter sp. UYP30]|uniref:hypothetical protein n=1 Tax=Pedobacter sp. UYP30 TaxID=1756400 RepID=UPI00339A7165